MEDLSRRKQFAISYKIMFSKDHENLTIRSGNGCYLHISVSLNGM